MEGFAFKAALTSFLDNIDHYKQNNHAVDYD